MRRLDCGDVAACLLVIVMLGLFILAVREEMKAPSNAPGRALGGPS